MLGDLEALTPPLVVAVAFLIGLTFFLRRQMGPGDPPEDDSDGRHYRKHFRMTMLAVPDMAHPGPPLG